MLTPQGSRPERKGGPGRALPTAEVGGAAPAEWARAGQRGGRGSVGRIGPKRAGGMGGASLAETEAGTRDPRHLTR